MASHTVTTPSGPTPRMSRGSIHTPLKPASVQDLKAKFDPGKAGDGCDSSASVPQSAKVKMSAQPADKKEQTNSAAQSGGCKTSSNITLASVNLSLQIAANRKTASTATSSASQYSPKSSVTLTTARPFSPPSLSSSKSGSASSSGRNSPCLDSCNKVAVSSSLTNKWELKSVTKSSSCSNQTNRMDKSATPPLSPYSSRDSIEREKEGTLDSHVMHISTSGSNVAVDVRPRGTTDNRVASRVGSSYLDKKTHESKLVTDVGSTGGRRSDLRTDSRESNPSLNKSDKLVAKVERFDSGISVSSDRGSNLCKTTKTSGKTSVKTSDVTSNVKMSNVHTNVKVSDVTNNVKAVSSKQSPISDSKKESIQPEFTQVKLRKIRTEQSGDGPESTSQKDQMKLKNSDVDDKRLSGKISSERFERLMFDFQRGVPTEPIPRRGSETDHIVLQQKARELSKSVTEDDVPVIAKKKKEQSIFTEGLKVSDFVKQVNKMNPDAEGPPKWKVQRVQSQASSTTSSDVGGDNFYQGIPGEDVVEDSDDDIYEKVISKELTVDEEQKGEFNKNSNRRLGVYRKQRGSKKKADKNKGKHSETGNSTEKRRSKSDGGVCDNSDSSSSGTEYEDVGPDENDPVDTGGECLYEDLETYTKPASGAATSKTITHKLKKIFYKPGGKRKKNKAFIDSGVSAGTESDADTVDDVDEVDSDHIEILSCTSSEQSLGHHVRDSTTSLQMAASTSDDSSTSVSSVALHSTHPAPPLPPRTTKALALTQDNSPPLPPRNTLSTCKSMLGNPHEAAVQVSAPGKGSGDGKSASADRSNLPGGYDPSAALVMKTENTDSDSASIHSVEKLERSDRKSGSSSGPSTSTGTPYNYPDISAFPELRGDNHSFYVDLEDEQMYGKASQVYVSQFESEPLYQWYSKDKVIQNMRSDRSTSDDVSSDDEYLEHRKQPESLYEDVERLLEKMSGSSTSSSKTASASVGKNGDCKGIANGSRDKPQRRSFTEDVFKNGGSLHRALWCQMPEVVESGILEKLTDQEKKLQEAMFEIITSEASYLKSLKVLISVFLMAPEFSAEMTDRCVISRRDRQILFSNIGHIKDISEEFLKDLEGRWQESYLMKDICDIISTHASQKFEPYVRYCGNQAFQDRALSELRLNAEFTETVKRLEQHPDCQFLPLASFLLLPMQRITRLPLLMDAICFRLEPDTPAHTSAKKAMDSITKVVKRCDDAAKKMQQAEQMCVLKSNLEFKVKEFPLISASRFLVKQGEMMQIKTEGSSRKPLSKLLGSNKEQIYLFLFSDILLVTKKKGTTFQVRDYCQRNAVHVEAVDNPDKSRHITQGTLTGVNNILFLAMLANHENRQVEMILSCKSESERTRWVDAITPKHVSTESERIYDLWDCPQFHCVRKYIAQQPDELTLEESDVINVTRKMADGWYEGERIRDGEKGWFPSSHTEEINNSHVRARNLRLRYRLLIASQQFSQMELHKKMTV